MYKSQNTANTANRTVFTDHLQEQSSRKFVVNQRSVRDHTSGTNRETKEATAESPRGDGPWKGQAGRPHGLVASLHSLKFQWKSLLVEKRGRDGSEIGTKGPPALTSRYTVIVYPGLPAEGEEKDGYLGLCLYTSRNTFIKAIPSI